MADDDREADCGLEVLSEPVAYGTRRMEYLMIRQFGEEDRTPEVFDGHLKDAVMLLWRMSH